MSVLEKFKLVELITTRTDAVATFVSGNQIKFNSATHVDLGYWTRFFIISTAANLDDLEPVTKRLLQNPKDFAGLFRPIFGTRAADRFEELFTRHLLIAADLVNAAKNGQTAKANAARNSWYKNADEIAGFLSSVNRCWDKAKWKEMLYSHLEMTEKEASLRLKGNYSADISVFDSIENEAFKMADYMFCGMIKTCP